MEQGSRERGTGLVDLRTLTQGIAVLVTGVFALIVLSGNPRKPSHQYLALFLLLIAGNQTAELVRSQLAGEAALRAFRIAAIFSAFDPFILYYWASIYPTRNALHTPTRLGMVGAGSLALLVTIPLRVTQVLEGGLLGRGAEILWAGVTGIVYIAVLIHLGRKLLDRAPAPALHPLFAGMAVAAIPAAARSVVPLLGTVQISPDASLTLVGVGLTLLALVLAPSIAWRVTRDRPSSLGPSVRTIRWSVAGASLLGLLFFAGVIKNAFANVGLLPAWLDFRWFTDLRPIMGATRWVLFSVFVSMALLKHQMLEMSLTARRRAARVLVAVATVCLSGVVVLFGQRALGSGPLEVDGFDLLLLGLVVLASQGFRDVVDRVAEIVYGVPRPGQTDAAVSTYQIALEQAAEEGRDLHEDTDLQRLREELGLNKVTAEALAKSVAATERTHLEPGGLFGGRYQVDGSIGRGGTGRVFRAVDTKLDREVALKQVYRSARDDGAEPLAEARAAGQLNHPHVLTVYDVIELPASVVLVTELADGGSLAEQVREHGPLEIEEGLTLIGRVLDGLTAVHDAGLVHKDLKPGNILLTGDGTPKIADFGIARARPGDTTTMEVATMVVGSPEYMAPEQLDGKRVGPAADLYAVARIMEACLEEPLPEDVQAVVDRALAEDPEERWGSAGQMGEALGEPASGEPVKDQGRGP